MGYLDLAEFYFEYGDLNESLYSFQQSLDHCSTSRQFVEISIRLIQVSLTIGDVLRALQYATQIEVIKDVNGSGGDARLVALAMAHMSNGNYIMAAEYFAKISPAYLQSSLNVSEMPLV